MLFTSNATSAAQANEVDVGDITGLVLYGVLWVVTVLAALRHLHRSMQDEPEDGRPRSWTVAGIFYALALSFVSVRVAWFALVLTTVHSFVQYSLNVIADLLFFSCFSLIVLHWSDENFSSTVGGSRGVSVTLARTLLAVNAVLYGFQLAVLTYINVNQYQTNPVLLVVSLSVAVFDNCLCAIGFLIFALRLWCSPSATHDTAVSGGMRRKIYLLLVVALVMTACFVARSVLYSLQVASSQMRINNLLYIDDSVRLILISVSEILPILFQLYQQRSRKKQEQQHETFIQALYDQSDSTPSSFDNDGGLITTEAAPLLSDDKLVVN